MPTLLRTLGFVVNERSHRCRCLLHDGKNPQAFCWRDEGLWHCFSCGRGGDKLALVQEIKGCNFKAALQFMAVLAGVKLADSTNFREELARNRRELKRRQIEEASSKAIEKQALLAGRTNVLELEGLRRNAGSRLIELENWNREHFDHEEEFAWAALALVAEQMPRATAAYAVIAFANAESRTDYAQHAEKRESLVNECLEAGGVLNDKNHFVGIVF